MNSIFCIFISTIIRFRCSRANRRRSSPRCTAGSTCPSTSRCSIRSPRPRWSRSRIRSAGRCRRRDWVRTIHHGLPEQPARAAARQAVIFRISGTHRAREGRRSRDPDRASIAACRSRSPPRSTGRIATISRRRSSRCSIRPNVEYIGEISDKDKSAFLSGAIALLVPIDWPEPFGLVMIEAMACGTPVIAFNRGSVPEVIDEGDRLHRRG